MSVVEGRKEGSGIVVVAVVVVAGADKLDMAAAANDFDTEAASVVECEGAFAIVVEEVVSDAAAFEDEKKEEAAAERNGRMQEEIEEVTASEVLE